jgi:hypothetical protein
MLRGKGWAVALGLALAGLAVAGPAAAHDKRTDRCGCHHQYGLRHCHPNKKTSACEAPARAEPRQETAARATSTSGGTQTAPLLRTECRR